MESVRFDDKIGHLYIVDIEFDYKTATKKQFAYKEIYPPIIEKQKTIDPCERSVCVILEKTQVACVIMEKRQSACAITEKRQIACVIMEKRQIPFVIMEKDS